MPTPLETLRIAAVGDLHVTRTSEEPLRRVLAGINELADVLLLCGDLTDYGLPEEAQVLARGLQSAVRIPIVAVLGNHDFESGRSQEVSAILGGAGVKVLDGEACEFHGVGFAGAKGFAGGFGTATLGSWGEPAVKSFVKEAIDESLKLEAALARLRTERRVAVLHYAPVAATLYGEPPEIFAFLGSSRLEAPLTSYPVDAVFHGHAHRGSTDGRTRTGTPVYNVALPLLRATWPDRPPVRVIEIPLSSPGSRSADRAAAPPPG